MTPARELHAALACDPALDDVSARDVATSVLATLGSVGRWSRDSVRALTQMLEMDTSAVDPCAALSGGARGDGGETVRMGGGR
jgi:hypothetical protein